MSKEQPTNEEIQKAQAEADARFNKMLETPLTKEEAELALANNDVKRMQLAVVRQKWQAKVAQMQLNIASLDEQSLALDMERAVIFRRTLNKADASAEAFKNAELVGKDA